MVIYGKHLEIGVPTDDRRAAETPMYCNIHAGFTCTGRDECSLNSGTGAVEASEAGSTSCSDKAPQHMICTHSLYRITTIIILRALHFCKFCEQPFGRKKKMAIIKRGCGWSKLHVVSRARVDTALLQLSQEYRPPTAKDTTIGWLSGYRRSQQECEGSVGQARRTAGREAQTHS